MRHSTHLALAAAVVALAAAPVTAAGQRAEALPVGARVRVHRLNPPPATVTGVLVRADSTGLTLAAADGLRPQWVPLGEVARVERHVGRRSAGAAFGRGAARGALVGAGTSAALLAAALISERRNPCGDCMINAPVAAAIVAVPLTVLSTAVGGAIGLRHRDRWAKVVLR